MLPPLLAQLQQAEPGIDVELVASNQLTNLLRREADIERLADDFGRE